MNRAVGLMALGLALAAAACTTTPTDSRPATPPEAGAGPCNADAAQGLVGETISAMLAGEAMQLTGAREFRWIQPNGMITMDYRPTRLNIEYDEARRVIAIRCG